MNFNKIIFNFIKFSFNLSLFIFATVVHSQQVDTCDLSDRECVQPTIGEYFYTVSGRNQRFASIDEIIQSHVDAVNASPPVQYCDDGFPKFSLTQEFSDYAEIGIGSRDSETTSEGWTLSTHSFSRIYSGFRRSFKIPQFGECVSKEDFQDVTRQRLITCPVGYFPAPINIFNSVDTGKGSAVCARVKSPSKDKNAACSNSSQTPVTGQPCDIRTGAKYRNETDFSYNEFTFTRNYHSLNLDDSVFGKGWHNQYFKEISFSSNGILNVIEDTGRGEPWRKQNGVWVGDADSDYLITESASGYTVTLKRGDIDEYDLSGRLLSETDTQGKVKTYEYDAENRLIKVSNHYQQFITFTYSTDGKNHITKVIDAQGIEYGYEYDVNDNLIAVVYPDGDSDPANNPKRIYHYEDTNFPNHITGITNANGQRYATFAYDSTGKAIESALAPTTNPVGQQRVQLNYQGAN